MKARIGILTLGLACLLFAVGSASAQQVLLPGALIPKFVDQLPVAGAIPVVNATAATLLGIPSTPSYTLNAREFRAQILPSTGVPANAKAGFAGLGPNTTSWVWGYKTNADAALLDANANLVFPSYLGPAVIAQRGTPATPTYENELPDGLLSNVLPLLPIDQTLDWADPAGTCVQFLGGNLPAGCFSPYQDSEIPIAVHIHGGEVAPAHDGGPDSWFTQAYATTGIAYPGPALTYPNGQEESTIWFHDHALGITRLNVFAGMAGIYPILDPGGPSAPAATMPAFPQHDIPLIIQDRSFDINGQIFYNLASNPQPNPQVHPFWIPEFIGDVILVNGKTWPNLNVEPRQYRFRLLNGSNARFYDLRLKGRVSSFIAIATDDGYLNTAVATPNVVIGPGERYEVIVDFTGLKPGMKVILTNSARTPFPGGAPVVRGTTDTVMQFTVVANTSNLQNTTIKPGTQIRKLTNPIQPIAAGHNPLTGSITRQLTLNEVIGPGGPLELVVNNAKYNLATVLPGSTTPLSRETELPAVGDTEIWEIINITADAHPMHTHLTSFQILDRTPFNAAGWIVQYDAALLASGLLPGEGPPYQYNIKNFDGAIGGNPALGPFLLLNQRRLPLAYEKGWKDTAIMYPGEVTRIAIRYAPQDAPAMVSSVPPLVSLCTDATPTNPCVPTAGINLYPFDPTALSGGVGYVWHCHIVDHEDNEMMRNYVVRTTRQPTN